MTGSLIKIFCGDNGIFPNSRFPALLYKGVLNIPALFAGSHIVHLFDKNDWSNAWKSGIFTIHHYHSTSHEVLGFYKGHTRLMLGGDNGKQVEVQKGDLLIIPAGMAHKNLGEENQVKCVGAYPEGRNYDMNYGHTGERPSTDSNISRVPLPAKDPLPGLKIQEVWNQATQAFSATSPLR